MRRMWIRAALAAPVLLAVAGCGGTSHRAVPVVSIIERDFHITAPREVPAGDVRVVLDNEGPVSHALLIVRATRGRLPINADGFTINDDALRGRVVAYIEPAGPGTRDFVVHVAPGRYIVLCNMAGHAASGMRTSFRVR
jgi:uncharacterized cupredoxin-like copper-binding protein